MQSSRHDNAVEDLSELGEGIAKRVVVGSPVDSKVQKNWSAR